MGQRIVTAIGLIAFLLVLLYFGGWVMAVATMVCTCFAVYEEYQALKTSGYHVVSWPTWTGFGIGVPREYTQKEVADALGISQSYISRIEKKIIKNLKRLIENENMCV